MNNSLFSVILFVFSVAIMSATCNTGSECIDESKKGNPMCTKEYKPVCGCDGVTYGNECMAKAAGVLKWEQGECSLIR